MNNLTEWLRLNFRVCLSATLMIEAAIGLVPQLRGCNLPSVVGGMQDLQYHSAALAALYFVLSFWLILGIRTSVVAAMAMALLVIPAIMTNPDGDPALAVKITLVSVFAVPLILYGGGRYSLYEVHEVMNLRSPKAEEA
ncbi:hypothetical protein [Nioella nitratireducens]|uniref:hypothetical protein n=1 Tax=Nioella nitratireducens TaxID=1287720 RepID=UPI0008FD22C6|nr:hypothetical protein [Nioella nitratireducens]